MKVLAFDSTARSASVAVLEDDGLLALYNVDNGLTHSELLLPMAENALSSLKLSPADIELFAVSVGPGSFTGVRIGAALVKGLAFGREVPCIGVSTLEALAENMFGTVGTVVAVMDARRAQVYTATFKSDGHDIERLTEDRAISLKELCSELAAVDGPIYLVGDGYEVTRRALRDAGITVEVTPPLLRNQSAYSIGRVAVNLFHAGKVGTDRELSPTYLRMPQAERERLERLNKDNK